MYNWFPTAGEFERYLEKMHGQQFVHSNNGQEWSDEDGFYLINYQEKELIKIVNQEVYQFFYDQVYMATVNKTYIDKFKKRFKYKEY